MARLLRGRCRSRAGTQGEPSNDKNLAGGSEEAGDHGIGRSRGGLTTKAHALVDGGGFPLVIVVTGGQAGDSPMLPVLLDALRVPRRGPGRPRTCPDALLGDKAYSARANRDLLRARGITTVIPEPSDQIGHRRNRGSQGGRPVNFDTETYKRRNVVERGFNQLKQWRGLATRYDKHATTYRGALVLASILLWLRK
jgi:transposase